MKTIRANDVRIPAAAREALDRNEEVLVVNHDRPAFVIVRASGHISGGTAARGRRLGLAAAILARGPMPDERFGSDLEAVRASTGPVPPDTWEPS